MKSVILSTSDIGGGAAIAGFRLHQGLRAIGMQSRMLVRDKISRDPDVEVWHSNTKEDAWLAAATAGVAGAARTANSSTFFSLPWPGHQVENHEWVREADLINIHWAAYYVSPESLRALLCLGKPVFLTLHDERAYTGGCHYAAGCDRFVSDCKECPQLHPPFQALASLSLTLTEACLDGVPAPIIVTPSRWLAAEVRRSRLLGRCRVEVIPYGLELDVFKPTDRVAARRWFGIPQTSTALLIGAQYLSDRRKGFDLVQQAIALLLEDPVISSAVERREVVFVAYGRDGDQLRKTRLPFCLTGEMDSTKEMARLFSAVDLYICPSREDNLPNTVLEAMACGVPVVGSNVGGIPDMIQDGANGLLVPPNDAGALAHTLKKLILNPQPLETWGRNARTKCERDYSIHQQARNYVQLHQETASCWLSQNAVASERMIDVRRALESACQTAAEKLATMTPQVSPPKASPPSPPPPSPASVPPPKPSGGQWIQRILARLRPRPAPIKMDPKAFAQTEILHPNPAAFLPPTAVLPLDGLTPQSIRSLAPLLRAAKLHCAIPCHPPHQIESWNLCTSRIRLEKVASFEEECAWLRKQAFALVPADDVCSAEAVESMCIRLACIGNLPILAIGDSGSPLAATLSRLGIGRMVAYDADALSGAVQDICKPSSQLRHRRNAAGLACKA